MTYIFDQNFQLTPLKHIIIPTLLLWSLSLCAQVYTKARLLTEKDGLSDNRVTCVFKDRAGFVWIGTRNGLNRYDGHLIKTFRPSAENSISNEVIHDIIEDKEGNLWVATMHGLNRYQPRTGKWDALYPALGDTLNDLPSDLIWDLHIDPLGKIWIVSDVYAFCSYDPATGNFIYYDWRAFVADSPGFKPDEYRSIKRVTPRNDREFWLASNTGLVLLNTVSGKFTFLGGGYKSDVAALEYDKKQGKVYLSAGQDQLFVYDENKKNYYEAVILEEPYPSRQYELPGTLETWMPSSKGLLRIKRGSDTAWLTRHIQQLEGTLPPGGVVTTLTDYSGIRWAGTPNGLAAYDLVGSNTRFLPLANASGKEGSNRINGVFYDDTRRLYLACSVAPAGVFLIDIKSGRIKLVQEDASGQPLSACFQVYKDRQHGLWLLTERHVYRYSDNDGRFHRFTMPNNGSLAMFRDMVQDAEGNYWFGSFNNGLYYYNTRLKKFDTLRGEYFKYMPTVTALHAHDKTRSVWIGTFSIGIFNYSLAEKKLSGYFETRERPDYAAMSLVQDISEDEASNIWIATQSGGLFRFHEGQPPASAFSHYNMKTGLDNNNYLSVCGGRGRLYALTGKGVSVIDSSGKFLYRLEDDNSFQFSSYGSDMRFPHRLYYHHGGLLLAGSGGGLLLYQTAASNTRLQFPIAITSVQVDERPIPADSMDTDVKHRLPYRFNSQSYTFAPLYYGAAGHFFIEYMLEGYDTHWKPANDEYRVSYQNLPAGSYTFHVRAVAADGQVISSASGPLFRILPPFWQTWWFILLCLVAGLLVIYFIFKIRIARIKKTAGLRQQFAELEAKALRAQMNPHFIFNSLNAIQELVITEKTEEAYEYLSKFSRLLRLVLNNSEKNTIALGNELEMIRLYLSLESLRFRQSFTYHIDVDEQIDPDETELPGLLVQPYIENALWHGLRTKEGTKTLALRFLIKEDTLHIEVEDNGIGRETAAKIKKNKLGSDQFESKGTLLSEQRIRVLSRQWSARATVDVTDLKNEDGLAAGTKVIIRLPGQSAN